MCPKSATYAACLPYEKTRTPLQEPKVHHDTRMYSSCANESIPSHRHRAATPAKERSIGFPCSTSTMQHAESRRQVSAHFGTFSYFDCSFGSPGVPSRLPQCISGKSNRTITAAIATTSAIIAKVGLLCCTLLGFWQPPCRGTYVS